MENVLETVDKIARKVRRGMSINNAMEQAIALYYQKHDQSEIWEYVGVLSLLLWSKHEISFTPKQALALQNDLFGKSGLQPIKLHRCVELAFELAAPAKRGRKANKNGSSKVREGFEIITGS